MLKRRGLSRLMILLLALSIPTFARAAEPFLTSLTLVPDTLAEPRPVLVTVEVRNTSQETISATLYDPSDNPCPTFGPGGTALLAPGASQKMTSTYAVTQAQLDAGRIAYSLRYAFTSESGERVSATLPVAARITYEGAVAEDAAYPVTAETPALEVQQETTTDMMVETGKTFTLAYRIINRGAQTVDRILLDDPGILEKPAAELRSPARIR